MIEVFSTPQGFIWQWICMNGRVLMESTISFPRDVDAYHDAVKYRSSFWVHAATIDTYNA